jgi:hypothetical protein
MDQAHRDRIGLVIFKDDLQVAGLHGIGHLIVEEADDAGIADGRL